MERKKWEDFPAEGRQHMDNIALRLTGRTLTDRREEMIKGSLKAVEDRKKESEKTEKKEPLQPIEKASEEPAKKTFKEEFPTVDRKVADLRDACEMAQWFDENKVDGETYTIKEGWDLYDIIHSLVVIYRGWKVLLSRAKENPPESLDKKERYAIL